MNATGLGKGEGVQLEHLEKAEISETHGDMDVSCEVTIDFVAKRRRVWICVDEPLADPHGRFMEMMPDFYKRCINALERGEK